MVETAVVDELERRTGLDGAARRDRASRAGQAAHNVSAYVRRVQARAEHLSADDLEVLREIVAVTEAQAFDAGRRAGRAEAIARIVAAAVD